ncbi:MAG: DNA methylase [Planctomycetes bacterium]|nr:DNA methylase [Planctomycetota bacterium]MCB9904686.1 DNA methylase [Planctomycetota bacterium]
MTPKPTRPANPRRQPQGKSEPKLHTTTLWHHPTQQYGDKRMGNPAYVGRTPVHVIHNLLARYTREDDLVVDPFCGGGTTLDVAHDLGRKAIGFDVAPSRQDIEKADARDLPLSDGVADFVFMDPPYSTHIKYSGDEACIGELDAFDTRYFEAMAEVFGEVHRILRDRRYLAVYVSDTFKNKKGFVPIGTHFMVMLAELFVPVDHICVVRGNKKLEDARFHKAALEENFYLRGFNHLLIFKKEEGSDPDVRSSGEEGRLKGGKKRRPKR